MTVPTSSGPLRPFKVLLITSEWPTAQHPEWVPFLVQQVEHLRLSGVEVDVFSFRGAKNPFRYLRAWIRVRQQLRSEKYDVAHAHFGQSGLLGLPKRVPLVVTFHGSDLEGIVGASGRYRPEGYVLRAVSRMVAQRADEVILVSASLARHLPERCPYQVIAGGVDLKLFKPVDKKSARGVLHLPGEGPLVLFGGQPHNPLKRYDLARRAMKLVRFPADARLIVADCVPHEQMPLFMSACDALLLTSRHEGSATVVKEALACNLPVVSVGVGDVSERLSDIKGCVVCADDRPESIAAALESVLACPVSLQTHKLAAESLDEAWVVQKLLQVYERAVCRPVKSFERVLRAVDVETSRM